MSSENQQVVSLNFWIQRKAEFPEARCSEYHQKTHNQQSGFHQPCTVIGIQGMHTEEECGQKLTIQVCTRTTLSLSKQSSSASSLLNHLPFSFSLPPSYQLLLSLIPSPSLQLQCSNWPTQHGYLCLHLPPHAFILSSLYLLFLA